MSTCLWHNGVGGNGSDRVDMFFAWQGNGPLGSGLHALGWVREGVRSCALRPYGVRGTLIRCVMERAKTGNEKRQNQGRQPTPYSLNSSKDYHSSSARPLNQIRAKFTNTICTQLLTKVNAGPVAHPCTIYYLLHITK
jgi:hypothetical protein